MAVVAVTMRGQNPPRVIVSSRKAGARATVRNLLVTGAPALGIMQDRQDGRMALGDDPVPKAKHPAQSDSCALILSGVIELILGIDYGQAVLALF